MTDQTTPNTLPAMLKMTKWPWLGRRTPQIAAVVLCSAITFAAGYYWPKNHLKQIKDNQTVHYELESNGHDYLIIGSVYDKTTKTDITRSALMELQFEAVRSGGQSMSHFETPEGFLLSQGAVASGIMPPENGSSPSMMPNLAGVSESTLPTLPQPSMAGIQSSPTTNTTDNDLNELIRRQQMLANEITDEFVVKFPASGVEKAVVTVITSPECPYCKAMHGDLTKLLNAGISIRYLVIPKHADGDIMTSMEGKRIATAMCATDRRKAAIQLFEDPNAFADGKQCEQGVQLARAMNELGRSLLVNGTPTLFGQGWRSEGYGGVADLLARIDSGSAKIGAR